MARAGSWIIVLVFLAGVLGAGVFWVYGPYHQRVVAQQVAEIMKGHPVGVEVTKGSPADLKAAPSQALGARFQMLADGKRVFLVDLREGRAWRYYHHTKEGGYAKEDEGFLPVAMFFGGKKHYSAGDIDATARPPEPPAPKGEKKAK
ncbi:MAG: hypothetical protein FJ126_11975 [Deltaproteobacteria bacterium]|nr:hypothetical protein [Deltaproteobacteria bacterium]